MSIITTQTTASFDFHQMAVYNRTTMLAHCNLKQNMWLCSQQSSFISFYALPSGGKLKDAVVHCSIVVPTQWHTLGSLPGHLLKTLIFAQKLLQKPEWENCVEFVKSMIVIRQKIENMSTKRLVTLQHIKLYTVISV